MSSKKEKIHRELTECQYCYKSKSPKVSLQKCAGCKVDLNCSKECQKSAWKTHKVKCALNQRVYALPDEQIHASKALRDFTSKHRPTINETAIRALNVFEDPSCAERDLLMIKLRPRLYSTRTQTAFCVTAANVVPIDAFPMAEDMRGQLKRIKEDDKQVGALGALLVVLQVIDTKSMLFLCRFQRVPPPSLPQPEMPWEDMLKIMLNKGLVV
ncbi:hypothetical protein B0H14DRAFT_3866343 [Mycena olivaceomarginata]|nr:hypothetical protein B0H14DRAFT_3866343 [Mycena olivaceomarginata]